MHLQVVSHVIDKAKLLLVDAQTALDRASTKAIQDVAREVRDQVKKNLEKLQTDLQKVLG